jgi:hypothetical protein
VRFWLELQAIDVNGKASLATAAQPKDATGKEARRASEKLGARPHAASDRCRA